MAISSTTVRVPYAGDGSTTTFGFAYEFQNDSDLFVYVTDSSDPLNPVQTKQVLNTGYSISGTKTNGIYLNGANVVMSVAPTTSQELIIIRAPSPIQALLLQENGIIPSVNLMNALDYLALVLQRHDDLLSRSVNLKDGFAHTFDTSLPLNINEAAGSAVFVNAAANGFTVSSSGGGPNISAFIATGPFTVTNGQSATDFSGETIDSVTFSSATYWFEVIRGASVFAKGWFDLQYMNSQWRIVLGTSSGEFHGITWSVTGTTIAQLQGALTSGSGDGTVKFKKLVWAAS